MLRPSWTSSGACPAQQSNSWSHSHSQEAVLVLLLLVPLLLAPLTTAAHWAVHPQSHLLVLPLLVLVLLVVLVVAAVAPSNQALWC